MAFGKGKEEMPPSRVTRFTVGGVLLVAIVGATAGIVIWQTTDGPSESNPCGPSPTEMGVFQHAAVSADASQCAEIGKNMISEGGSVVDAAIATVLCMGVIHPMSSGVGGGFFMILYNATTQTSRFINAREKAPGKATQDMFEGDPEAAARGPLAVAVPGELKGLWELYKQSGVLPWADLIAPAIELCRNGFKVTKSLANALSQQRNTINNTPSLKEILWNNDTNDVFKEGEIMKRPVLANTLEHISTEGNEDSLYNGEIMEKFVADLKDLGGIIDEEDMKSYEIDESDTIEVKLGGGFTLHTVPPPGSGILVAYMMQLLNDYLPNPDPTNVTQSVIVYQRIAEAFKHTYALRTRLGDPADPNIKDIVEELVRNMTDPAYIADIRDKISDDMTHNDYEFYGAEYYQPDDHGTSQVSIIAENGDAIGVTMTVNLAFGALIRSTQTGIIYNDEMDDFSAPNITNSYGVPPSPNNFIEPGKRPMSSMAPSIFTDEGGRVRLVIGATGGTTITTSVAQIAIRNLWFGSNIKESIDAFRIHHQLYPMKLYHEECLPEEIAKGLEKLGHTLEREPVTTAVSSTGVARSADNTIYASIDWRKAGSVAGY